MTLVPTRGKLFQAGYVVRDVHKAIEGAQAKAAIQKWHVKTMEPGGMLTAMGFAWVDGFMWELLEADPKAEPNVFQAYLPDSPGDMRFHHLGYMLENQTQLQEVMARYADAGVGTAVHMELPGVLECYYADTLQQLGHYTEYVYLMPGCQYFDQAPHN
jgi:hypothetical protein